MRLILGMYGTSPSCYHCLLQDNTYAVLKQRNENHLPHNNLDSQSLTLVTWIWPTPEESQATK